MITLTSQNDLNALLHDNIECVNVIVTENLLPSVHSHRLQRTGGAASAVSLLQPIDTRNIDATKEWKTSQHLAPLAPNSRTSQRFPLINDTSQPCERVIRWKRGEVLGQGAFGVVYLGLNVETGELMAVKLIESSAVTEREVSSLENEINLLRNLKHPNIVRYLGMEVAAASLAIFLEYIPGGSLKTVVDKFGRLEESVVRSYTRQVLLGLEYLHRNGIAHRDVKSANCLVANDGVIKLADFGSSRHWRPSAVVREGGDIVASDIRGTPSWMAPEVIRNQDQHLSWKKADVWSLGCTTIEMSTGKVPWCQYSNPVTVLYHIACSDSLPEFPESASVELISFLNVCLQRDASHRPDITSLLLHPFVASASLSTWHAAGGAMARPSTVSTAPGGNGWEERLSPVWKAASEHTKSVANFPHDMSNAHRNHVSVAVRSASPVYELDYPPETSVPPVILQDANDTSTLAASDDELAVASVEGAMDDECTLLSFDTATDTNLILDTATRRDAAVLTNVHFPDTTTPRLNCDHMTEASRSVRLAKTPLVQRSSPFVYSSEPPSQHHPPSLSDTDMNLDASFENDSLRDDCEMLDEDAQETSFEFRMTAVSPDADSLLSPSCHLIRQARTAHISASSHQDDVSWSREIRTSTKKAPPRKISSTNPQHQQVDMLTSVVGQAIRSTAASSFTAADSPSGRKQLKTRQTPAHRSSSSQLHQLSGANRPPTAVLSSLEISGDTIDPRFLSTRHSNVRTANSQHFGTSIDLSDEAVEEDCASVALEHFESVLCSTPMYLNEHTAAITKIRIPNGRSTICSASGDGTVKVWGLHDVCDTESIVPSVASRATFDGNGFPGTVIDASRATKKGSGKIGTKMLSLWVEVKSSSDVVWAGGSDGHVRLWSCDEAKPLRLLKGHEDNISAMEGEDGLSGSTVATGSSDKTIRIWDGRARKPQVMILKGHTDAVTCLLWTDNGRCLVSASKDKTIKQWDTRIGRCVALLEYSLIKL